MADTDSGPAYRFTHKQRSFQAFEAKTVLASLEKWGMKERMTVQVFGYDKCFYLYNKEEFIKSFFSDPTVQTHLQVVSQTNRWAPIGKLETVTAVAKHVPASVTNMAFFDTIYQEGLVRDSGDICKCFDEQYDDILVSDELRKMMLSDESDFLDTFDAQQRSEFLYVIFKHLCIGGAICQYEDNIQDYLDTAKFLYKDLVSVHRDASTGGIAVNATVLNVTARDANDTVYPSNKEHLQTFSYFIINPVKRQVVVWCHSW